jgi:hypothetical protein
VIWLLAGLAVGIAALVTGFTVWAYEVWRDA